MTDFLTTLALGYASTLLFHITLTIRRTMSKDKKKEETQTATEPEQPTVETPPEEPTTAPQEQPKEKPDETTFVCPACQHTASIKLGNPYKTKSGHTFQLVQCAKCSHVTNDVV